MSVAVDAPTGMGTRERRDLAAWWAMNVRCQYQGGCVRPAAWRSLPPCGCRTYACDPHKQEWEDQYQFIVNAGQRLQCADHGEELPVPFPWRLL